MHSKNFVEQVKSLRINFEHIPEPPSANSKLPYFMDSKKGGVQNHRVSLAPKIPGRQTKIDQNDIVRGLGKGDKPALQGK